MTTKQPEITTNNPDLNKSEKINKQAEKTIPLKSKSFQKFAKIFAAFAIFSFVLSLIGFGVLYALTPTRFAFPKTDHYHFRFQYVFRGQAENFASPRYQVDYLKDVCDGGLTDSPIHFHDNKDQLVHLHWQKMTGGDVLKFYGVNKVGGLDGFMGYKLDDLFKFPPKLTAVPIHSNSMPIASGEDKYFVYTGDKDKFEKRDFNQFINQNLEEFLGKNSILREQFEEVEKLNKQSGLLDFGALKVFAHNGVEHKTQTEAEQHEIDTKKAEAEKKLIEERNNQAAANPSPNKAPIIETAGKSEEELEQVNNLIGNVVIFVQPNEPTNDQIKARFDKLEPLGLSVCGG